MAGFYSKDGKKRCFVEEKGQETDHREKYKKPYANSRNSEACYKYKRNIEDERFHESADFFRAPCSTPPSSNEYACISPPSGNEYSYLAPSSEYENSNLAPSSGNGNLYSALSIDNGNLYIAPSSGNENSYLASYGNNGMVQYPINVSSYAKTLKNKFSFDSKTNCGEHRRSREDINHAKRMMTRKTGELRQRETIEKRSPSRHHYRNRTSSKFYERLDTHKNRLSDRKFSDKRHKTVGSFTGGNKKLEIKSKDCDFQKVSTQGQGHYGSPNISSQGQGQNHNFGGYFPIGEEDSSNLSSSSISEKRNDMEQCFEADDQIIPCERQKDDNGVQSIIYVPESDRTLQNENRHASHQSESNDNSESVNNQALGDNPAFSKSQSLSDNQALPDNPAFALLLEKQKQFLEKAKCVDNNFQSDHTSGQSDTDRSINIDQAMTSGPRQCNLCLRYFQTQNLLTEHIQHFHPMNNGTLSKNFPDMNLSRLSNMASACNNFKKQNVLNMGKLSNDKHSVSSDMPTFSEDPNIQYVLTCLLCVRMLYKPKMAHDHFESTHTEYNEYDNVYKCVACDKKFYKVEEFRTHMIDYHTGLVPQHPDGTILKMPITCKICHMSCKRLKALRKHMYRKHIKSFLKCPICGYRTILDRNMNHHMFKFHTSEKPFKCNLCNMTFDLELELNEHKLNHTSLDKNETNNSECEFCGEILHNKTKWIRHMKRVHEIVDMRRLKDYNKFFT